MKKTFSRIHLIVLALALASLACNISAPATATSKIGGIISSDINGNGVIDSGEGALDNAIVTLSGCGETQTALSADNGYFEFSELSAGLCVIEVTKGGWEFSASAPDLGYPMPIIVEDGKSVALTIYMRPTDASAIPPVSVEETPTSAPTGIPLTATPNVTATPSAAMVSPTTQDVNCRFGPSIKYSAVDALLVGDTVPIIGRTSDSSWWQVEGPRYGNANCFVAANVTQTSGELGNIPVVSAPAAFATDVSVHINAKKGTYCAGPHEVNATATITTNGPTTVEYRFNLGSNTTDTIEGFYETFEVSEFGETHVDIQPQIGICGDFFVEAQVKSPNIISKKATFSLPGPSKNGVPAIETVTFRKTTSGNNTTVYQDIFFQDSDGDVIKADWTLIATTPFKSVSVADGTVTKPAARQIGGTYHTGTWQCGSDSYIITFEIILIDSAGNSSAPYTYNFSCN